MDFLDQTVGKAKEIFEVACKKTEEAVSTGKQKLDIAALENKLNKEYRLLGKLYYICVKNGAQTDLEDVIKTIDSIKEQIESKEKEILENSNKKVCSNCGKKVDDDAIFCKACGQKQI